MTEAVPVAGNYFLSNIKFALGVIAKKWTIDILMVLCGDAVKFSQIERFIPAISSKVLSERLAELQEYRLIRKEIESITPLSAFYTTAPRGLAVLRALSGLSPIGFQLQQDTAG